MTAICPTVTAYDPHEYREQMERIASFVRRVHIDLMDGRFAPTKSPGPMYVWWPDNVKADIHLMYERPLPQLSMLIKLRPHTVIIHAEADVDHAHFAASLRRVGIRAGLALLSETPVENVEGLLKKFDHVLIFSGRLGYHGGRADLGLLDKVRRAKEFYPDIEIGWDGGINDQNIRALMDAGVDVLNVGGFIAGADDQKAAYAKLEEVIRAQ